MRFVVAIHKDTDSSYGVTVPDLPGCISSGDTLDEAFDQAREAIKGHIETLLMTSQHVPKMRPLQEHQAQVDFQDALCWGFVDVDLASIPSQGVRVNIMLPSGLLSTIDEHSKLEGETRSGFLAKAALEYIRGAYD